MKTLLTLLGLAPALSVLAQSTITPDSRLAWAGNLGWLNFRPERPDPGDGFRFGEFACAGHLWAPNVGWINCGDGTPADGVAYANQDGADFGVNHAGTGDLSGLAWAPNVGWINFGWARNDPGHVHRPRVDLATGEFAGFAWSANCGWISLGGGRLRTEGMHVADSDNDGIADAFERRHAGNLKAMSALSDTDQDGVSDRDEYLALSDPLAATSSLRIEGFNRDPAGQGAEISWSGSPERLYRVLVTTDFATWTAVSPDDWQFGATEGLTRREVPLTGDATFYRIEVRRPLID